MHYILGHGYASYVMRFAHAIRMTTSGAEGVHIVHQLHVVSARPVYMLVPVAQLWPQANKAHAGLGAA